MIEKRRDELLAKAAELFQKKGYHATTMKDIAAELQILPGSLYHHIDSKQSLLQEIMGRGIEALLQQVRPVVLSQKSATEKLKTIIAINIQAIAEQPAVLTVFLHEMKSLPMAKRGEQIKLRDEYNHLVKQVIEEGIQSGEFRPIHANMTTFAIFGMVNWLYTWYRPTGSLTPTQITDQFVTLIMHGLSDSAQDQQAITGPVVRDHQPKP